jgi:peptidoglycan/xylan/chitin deacetylase (PgdA/CDA1 family)
MDKAFIIITIDVEDFFLPRPRTDMIFAKMGNEYYGITKIMDIMDNHNIKGTFFVDVYNRETLTEGLISEACQEIDRRGHEVALHTHPEIPRIGRYEIRATLSSRKFGEQVKVIEEGKDLIQKWVGKAPLAHRAGAYGANYETLKALKINNIPVDSSMFYGHRMCGLNHPPLTINQPTVWENVLELPISVTLNRYRLKIFGLQVGLIGLYKKVDLYWCSLRELKKQILKLKEHQVNPIIIFLHSYSLVSIRKKSRPNYKALNNFQELVQWMMDPEDTQIVTVRRFYEVCNGDQEPGGENEVPVLVTLVNDLEPQEIWEIFQNVRLSHAKIILESLQKRLM